MLAFTADYFGSRNVGPIYGLMLTAWDFASAFGPLAYAASQRQLPRRRPRDRGRDAGVYIASAYRLPAQEKHVLGSSAQS